MEKARPQVLDLCALSQGMAGLTANAGGFMAECASVCLEERGHSRGVGLRVSGKLRCTCDLNWLPVTEQMRRAHNDAEVATEHGAYAVAILLVLGHMGYEALEKSVKGTGFDYWVGDASTLPFQKKARLEVSGIRSGNAQDVAKRVKDKKAQTRKSDGEYPACVVVVEFGKPRAQVVLR
ncbi:MAG: hypothetical protein IMZ65_02870 [Planctomycetes bacterium]|nr:hypothetical protein [Planctomycetota bacterium]